MDSAAPDSGEVGVVLPAARSQRKRNCGCGDLELPDALGGEGRRMGGAAGGQVRWPASCRGE
jgi:hypothetical protein